MPDYSKAVIYKLCCKDPNIKDIYVGSTTNFKGRKAKHKVSTNCETDNGYNQKKYQFIRDNGGWNNWDMVMVKEFSCENKRQLHTEERKQFEELNATLNSQIPNRTPKEYVKDNKNKIFERSKKWHELNKEKMREYNQKKYINNKEKFQEYNKKTYIINKDKLKEYQKEYSLKNKEKIKEKVGCRICKCMVVKSHFKRHTKSLKHINNLQ